MNQNQVASSTNDREGLYMTLVFVIIFVVGLVGYFWLYTPDFDWQKALNIKDYSSERSSQASNSSKSKNDLDRVLDEFR